MSVKYLCHEDDLFAFHLGTCRMFRLQGGRRDEVQDPAIRSRIRLGAREISPAQVRTRRPVRRFETQSD
jgi:hypothetical protein